MNNSMFYTIPSLKTTQPKTYGPIELETLDGAVILFYVGNGTDVEEYFEYCADYLDECGLALDSYANVEVSDNRGVAYICMPKALMSCDELIDNIHEAIIKGYRKTFYTFVEFGSVIDMERFVKANNNRTEGIRYDEKRKVFYYLLTAEDSSSWEEFGKLSSVSTLRYKCCRNAGAIFAN